jgi:hypothetical protein
MGFSSSLDLVSKNPTIYDQLSLVYEYLSWYAPFKNKQALYMSVFYPAAKNWPENQLFPDSVRMVNPGINTPKDYVNKVEGTLIKTVSFLSLAGLAAWLFFTFKQKKDSGGTEDLEESEGEYGQTEKEDNDDS